MATVGGEVNYRSVLPLSLNRREAFDGSVPYGISCTGLAAFNNSSGGDASSSVVFSLIGQPGDDNAYGSAASVLGISRQVAVDVDDFWFDVFGLGAVRITVAACDPSSFPDYTKTILYDCRLSVDSLSGRVRVKVPSIGGIVLSGNAENPLNICVRISCTVASGSNIRVVYHGVSVVDD